MAISSEDLRQRLLAQLINRPTPRTIGGAFGDVGNAIATAIQLRRDVPRLREQEREDEAKGLADRLGAEVSLRDALISSGVEGPVASGIASAPADVRGALLSRIPTALETERVDLERTKVEQTAENQRLSRDIDKARLQVAQRQAATAELRAQTAAQQATVRDAQIDTVRMPDGSVRSFRRDDPALDQAIGQGGVRFNAQVQAGDVAGIGGATTATQSRAQQTIDSGLSTLGTIQQLRESLRPENVGISGNIRELGIGALGQVEAFRAWADDQSKQIIDQAIASGDTLDLNRFADDPDLSAQRVLENILTYQYSKAISPGDRTTDQDFRQNFKALGFGKKLTSVGDLLNRLDTAQQVIERTIGIAERRLGVTSDQGQVTSPKPSSGRAPRGKVTRRIVFDAQGQEVVQ